MQSVRDNLASSTGFTVFIADEAGEDLRDELVRELISDGARCITVDAGQSMMDYVAPLFELEDGHTAILNGVQNISEEVIDDFLRIVCDRVLVGTIGEGDAARSFETAIPQFNLVLVDHGSEELNFGTLRMRQASQLVVTEISLTHRRLLSSKLGKKASTNLGAIHFASSISVISAIPMTSCADLMTTTSPGLTWRWLATKLSYL